MNAMGSGVHWRDGVRRVWRVARWILLAIVVLYIAVVIYRIPHAMQVEKDVKVVAQIQSQKLTMDDVDGNHLPPPPDPQQANATVAGVDVNGNGIRDDVELAIFDKYPGQSNVKIRAAELQYAMELQEELINVSDSATLIAAVQQEGRGYGCIFDTTPRLTLNDPHDKWVQQQKTINERTDEVENLVFNTVVRKQIREDLYKKYMTSYSELQGEDCDIQIKS